MNFVRVGANMASYFFFGILLLAVSAFAGPSRIIGGTEVPIERYPSVVQVEALNQGIMWLHQCGGAILNSVHVMTAAHCVSGTNFNPEQRRIRAGTATKESGGVRVYIAQVFNHPSWGQLENDGDISVVRLQTAFIFTATLNQAQIAAAGLILPAGLGVTKVGWGVTSTLIPVRSYELQEVQVPVVDHAYCRDNYAALGTSPTVTENMFCAGTALADSCDGDGGGPVFFGNVIIGIISWGTGCGVAGLPGVSTFVPKYVDWIVTTVSS